MALLKCPECGNNVSEYADKCQSCGCPIDVIKNHAIKNKYTLTLRGGELLYLEKLFKEFNEEDLKNTNKLQKFLIENYNDTQVHCLVTVLSIIESTNYTFPDNIQDAYEAMCAKNRASHANIPTCPHCKSTNISKISTGGRILSVATLGLASNKINKSFKCKSCGYTW